jgi:very-short-patch-repair endonuclease
MSNTEKLLKQWIDSGNKIKKLKTTKKKSKKIKRLILQRKTNKRKKLQDFSKELNKNMAQSEIWFKSLYEKHNLKMEHDLFNKPLKSVYIPDVLNRRFKYVIEIDGSIHRTKSQIETDNKKDIFYSKCNMFVIRIIAYDIKSYIDGMNKLIDYRKTNKTKEFINFCLDILK